MLDSKAAVAAIGSLKKLPSYSDIEIGLLDKDVRQLCSPPSELLVILLSCRGLYHPRESSKYSDESRGATVDSGILPENIVNKFLTKYHEFLA